MMPHSRCRRSVFLILVAALFTWNAILCADTGKHTLDVGAGEAVERLKFVAYQVDVELLFGTDLPTDVVTNPIAGHFTAEEALNRMLEGTPLAVVPVSDCKAFGIINRAKNGETAAPSQQNLPPISTTTEELPKMNLPKRTFFNSFAAVLTLGIAGTPPQVFSQEADESVYELSPFTVESDDNVGYLATSSLAGTRLK